MLVSVKPVTCTFQQNMFISSQVCYTVAVVEILWDHLLLLQRKTGNIQNIPAQHAESATACSGKSVSDPIVGEFVFNYILNMLNAQKSFSAISSPSILQQRLLMGDTFQSIAFIEPDGLNDLYNMLLSGNISGEIYGNDANFKVSDSGLSNLQSKKQKLERALDRLTNLYLYSDTAISEREYIVQKTKLTDSLDEINEQIGFIGSDGYRQAISDNLLIERASQFIIAQKLSDRNYISYKRLAMSVEATVLQSFVRGIIDNIIIDCGHVKQITFRNGLAHIFVYKDH